MGLGTRSFLIHKAGTEGKVKRVFPLASVGIGSGSTASWGGRKSSIPFGEKFWGLNFFAKIQRRETHPRLASWLVLCETQVEFVGLPHMKDRNLISDIPAASYGAETWTNKTGWEGERMHCDPHFTDGELWHRDIKWLVQGHRAVCSRVQELNPYLLRACLSP